jgi:RNA polymerase sigma factor (sigma-70 family)
MRSHLARRYGHDVAEELAAAAIAALAEDADLTYEDAQRRFAKIILNDSTDYARLARHGDAELEAAIGGATPFPTIEIALLRRSLVDAIRSLPSPEREAFALTELRGLTQPEAAAALGIAQQTVSRRAERARLHLQKELT